VTADREHQRVDVAAELDVVSATRRLSHHNVARFWDDRSPPRRRYHEPVGSARPVMPAEGGSSAPEMLVAPDLSTVVKPRLRGWLHAGMVPLVLVGGVVLLFIARTPRARFACAIFAISALLLFGVSALYHRFQWSDRKSGVLRRLDHANIFLIIAGTYTPTTYLLLRGRQQEVLLILIWSGAVAGIAFRVLWLGAPRWIYTPVYIALGWAAVFYLPAFHRTGGSAVVALIITGGLFYTAGGIVYATKRPDPSPRWFGFHEIFHALTIAAFLSHYLAVAIAAHRTAPS
jgi:hemolysin III